MFSIDTKTIIKLLKAYEWGSVWLTLNQVDEHFDELVTDQKPQFRALQAMLLAGWWQDPGSAKALLVVFPRIISDPLTHFAVSYAWMAIGDNQKIKYYRQHAPTQQPSWMKDWLAIEIYGRSLAFDKQITHVIKCYKNPENHDWVRVALLQSLEHKKAQLDSLISWLDRLSPTPKSDPLTIALAIRAGVLNWQNCSTPDASQPLLLSLYAYYLYITKQANESMIALDQLVCTGFIDLNKLNQWLSLSCSFPQGLGSLLNRVEFALSIAPKSITIQGTIASYGLVYSWLTRNYENAYILVKNYNQFRATKRTEENGNAQVFFRYVLSLCVAWQHNQQIYAHVSGATLSWEKIQIPNFTFIQVSKTNRKSSIFNQTFQFV